MRYVFFKTLLPIFVLLFASKSIFAYDELRKTKTFTDAILLASDGSQHPCHRAVLAVSSPYFKKMFTIGMKETEECKVSLPYSGKAVEIILTFLYDVTKWGLEDARISLKLFLELSDFCRLAFIENLKNSLTRSSVDVNDLLLFSSVAEKSEEWVKDALSSIKPAGQFVGPFVRLRLEGGALGSYSSCGKSISISQRLKKTTLWDVSDGRALTADEGKIKADRTFNAGKGVPLRYFVEKAIDWTFFKFAELSRDEKWIAAAHLCSDGIEIRRASNWVHLFSLKNISAAGNITYLPVPSKSVQFSPDDSEIVTVFPKETKVWSLPPQQLCSRQALRKSKDFWWWILLRLRITSYFENLPKDKMPSLDEFFRGFDDKEILDNLKIFIDGNARLKKFLHERFRKSVPA